MKKYAQYILFAAVLLFFGCGKMPSHDPLRRSRADALNKEAFVNRYRRPDSCLVFSQRALQYIHDSLPGYIDGELRAYNNMAFAYYQKSDRDQAVQMLEKVDRVLGQAPEGVQNADVERVIAQLIKARLMQRDCRIADCYRLLYEIDRSRVLQHSRDNLLYNYAQTEYYITTLVLNFHYREGKQADVRELLNEVEARRSELKVDFAQDMALNYALAYGWQSAGESLTALEYCDRNYDILQIHPEAYCPFHYANTMQMEALALKSIPGMAPPDSVLALYDMARRTFFDYGDPYQMLGGTVSTARYALLVADTALAHSVLAEWRAQRDLWQPFSAPKMELSYFDVLLRSRMAVNADQGRRWYEHHAELQDRIAQNEKEDFQLQQTLLNATRRSRWMSNTAMALAVMAMLLLAALLLLWRNTLRLHREKRQLEEAKRRDVERIANVETCLSVMRHDVTPFVGYLSSPNLTPELREEVTSQLLRTFDNIKNWTRLSIPTGLAFNASVFPLREVFDEVRGQLMRPHAGVELTFEPTSLKIWGDRLLVTIMMRNLVTNALQHTGQGTVAVRAEREENKMIVISVADTGCGMAKERVDTLFRADRQVEGEHGFGLILCRYIVKKHDDLTRRGCRIWAESEEGKGTTMKVRLAESDT